MDVARYFMVQGYVTIPDRRSIRVNGYPVNLPLRYISGGRHLKVEDLYDYIGLQHPTLKDVEDWETRLLITPDDPRPPPPTIEIDVPQPAVPVTPAKGGTPTLLQREAAPEMGIMFWYLRNIGKYPGVCMPLASQGFTANIISLSRSTSIFVHVTKADFTEVFSSLKTWAMRKHFGEILRLCMDVSTIKRIFLPISWQYKWDVDEKKHTAHANFMIIDKTVVNPDGSMNVYIFDPWGETVYEKAIVALPKIMDWIGLGEESGYKWRFRPSVEWCPKFSFQLLEEITDQFERIGDYGGFCGIWTMWVIDVLLRNPGKDYSVVIRSALDQLSRDAPSFRGFIRRYARTIEDYGDELAKKLSLEFDVKGDLLPSDVKKLEEYIGKIRTEMVAKLEKEYTKEFGPLPSAEGIKIYRGYVWGKVVIYGNFTTALRERMAREYDLYITTGFGDNPFRSEPRNMYAIPRSTLGLEFNHFLEQFPEMVNAPRTFPDHNLWYKDRSEDKLALCGEPTEDEKVAIFAYDWKPDETQKCYIFRKSQLEFVKLIFPDIQKR